MLNSNIGLICFGVFCLLVPFALGISEDAMYERCKKGGTVCHGMTGDIPGSDPKCYEKKACNFVVALYSDSDSCAVTVDFWGKTNLKKDQMKYIAMGISDDNAMGDDIVYVCANQETVSVFSSWNNGKSNEKILSNPPTITPKATKLTDSGTEQEQLSCSITIPYKYLNGPDSISYDLSDSSKKYFILLAVGKELEDGKVEYHSSRLSSEEASLSGPSLMLSTKPCNSNSGSGSLYKGLIWLTSFVIGAALAIN